MTSNRTTLDQALSLSVRELAQLPIGQIALLLEDVSELKSYTKKADEHLFAALHERFAERANEARQAKQQDTGTVRLPEGDYVVIADLPKKPTWTQTGLREIEQSLRDMGEPPEEYISVKRDVSERAYGAWPSSIRILFDPHRTVGVGKASFKIERKKDAA